MADNREHIELVVGDITSLEVDAIVNAANETLLGGGGVDGAIHRAAGPELVAECRGLRGCSTGKAKVTGGYQLPAQWVIHTVGPVWRDGAQGEDDLLASCYRESLDLALAKRADSVAFPAISTGAYRFPKPRAATIALETALDWQRAHGWPLHITFCCFDDADVAIYRDALALLEKP